MRSLECKQLIIELARSVVLLHDKQIRMAVMFSTYEELKLFNKLFLREIGRVPEWLLPTVTHSRYKKFRWCDGEIMFALNPLDLKGCSYNHLYVSSRAMKKSGGEILSCLLPAVGNKDYMTEFNI